jgi:hypothetical protein
MQCQSCTNCIPGNYYKLVHTSNLHTGTVLLRSSAAKVRALPSSVGGGAVRAPATCQAQLLQPVRELQHPAKQPNTPYQLHHSACQLQHNRPRPSTKTPKSRFPASPGSSASPVSQNKQSDATHSVYTAKQPTTCRLQQHTYTMYSLRFATLRRPCTHDACIGPSKHAGEVAHQQKYCMMSVGQNM